MKAGDRRPGLPPINHNDPISNLDDSTVLPVAPIRFTPRRPGSNWSDKNRRSARRLLEEERMTPAGQAVLPDDL